LAAELHPIADTKAGDPGICNGPKNETARAVAGCGKWRRGVSKPGCAAGSEMDASRHMHNPDALAMGRYQVHSHDARWTAAALRSF
jgi:hypothetical protein